MFGRISGRLATALSVALLAGACAGGASSPPAETPSPSAVASGAPATTPTPTLSVEKLTVRYGPIADVQLMAQEMRLFEDALGIPIEWITINGGAATIAAMQGGSLDIGCGVGTPPIAAAAAQDVPIRVFWIQDDAAEPLAVKGVSSVKELAGKRIAAVVGSTMYFALVVALNKEEVPLTDVQIIDLPLEETVAAYKRGDIDGAIMPHPLIDELVADGATVIMTPEDRGQKYGYALFDSCVVLEDFAKGHPDVLEKWVQVEDAAIKFWKENPDEAYAAIARKLDIDPATAKFGLESAAHPTAAEQTESLWLGKPGETGTGVATAIAITAALQLSLGRIPTVPSETDSLIDATFVSKVAAAQ